MAEVSKDNFSTEVTLNPIELESPYNPLSEVPKVILGAPVDPVYACIVVSKMVVPEVIIVIYY
jgi:hypothetical protein